METSWPKLAGGAAALDFANTALVPEVGVVDELGHFLAWSRHAGVPLGAADGTTADGRSTGGGGGALLARAATVRSALLEVATAHADGEPPSPAHLAVLADAYRWALEQAEPELDQESRWTWSWQGRPMEVEALARLAVEAVDVLSRPLDRLKACGSCRFVFLDTSKNNSRRWCSMDDCGTKEKMRRYVEKRAAANRRSRQGRG